MKLNTLIFLLAASLMVLAIFQTVLGQYDASIDSAQTTLLLLILARLK